MIMTAIGRALRDLAQRRILAVLLLPMIGALVIWTTLGFIFWDAWTTAFGNLIADTALARWIAARGWEWLLQSMGVIVIVALLIPATLVTAALVTELVAMPVIVAVAGASYPTLEKRSGGTLHGSLANAAAGVSIFVALWLLTLPLWLTGVGAALVPALTAAYLNQRLFRYDALAEHASREEYRLLVARNKVRLFGLGLVLAPLYYVPVVNLAAPVVAGLTFSHFCLAELGRVRRARAAG